MRWRLRFFWLSLCFFPDFLPPPPPLPPGLMPLLFTGDGLRLVCTRSKLMNRLERDYAPGVMAAVFASVDQVKPRFSPSKNLPLKLRVHKKGAGCHRRY